MAAAAAVMPAQAVHAAPETELVTALEQLRSGHYDDAFTDLDTLVGAYPDFRLAQYLYAGLLTARAGRPGAVRLTPESPDGPRAALLNEARLRWQHYRHEPPLGAVPNAILRLAPNYHHAIVVDLEDNRLYVFRNQGGRPRLIADYYASIGAGGADKQFDGDARTPVGIYHVTEYLDKNQVPAFYGDGAFPLNYPNAWDRYFGRTGSGIWLHGVPPQTYNRRPRASQGCVVLSNRNLDALRQYVRPGITPVVLTDDLHWLSPNQALEAQRGLLAAVRGWRNHWQNMDDAGYRAYYRADLVNVDGPVRNQFAAYRRQVSAKPGAGPITLDNISVYRYPGEDNLAMVAFTQRYADGHGQQVARKHQFWRLGPKRGWQIVQEVRTEQPAEKVSALGAGRARAAAAK